VSRPLRFTVTARDGAARRGILTTPHGVVETPAFMPVGTYGAVRGVSPDDLVDLGAQITLTNTYHLHERPGEEVIARAGGLHGWTGWQGPWLTDSGGFQVTSLLDRARIDEDGVTFASPVDGRKRQLTPEGATAIQESLAADIAMVLDQCIPVAGGERAHTEAAMERSLRWAARCRAARSLPSQAMFGIVQGGVHADLRRRSARETTALGFDGHAHGGLGLGESREQRAEMLAEGQAELPEDRPRYLMGLGRPEDLVDGVAAGVDLFDCVVPTRHARHGLLFTGEGELAIRNARFREDPAPLDPDCDCPACRSHSRGYLRHLFQVGESLGPRLASLHNLRFYLKLMERCRAAIGAGRQEELRQEIRSRAKQRVS
jgi:queuine tRNA-ribosyltransferase